MYVTLTLVSGERLVAVVTDEQGGALIKALTEGKNPDDSPHLGWSRFPDKDGREVVLRLSSVMHFTYSETKPEGLAQAEQLEEMFPFLFSKKPEVKP